MLLTFIKCNLSTESLLTLPKLSYIICHFLSAQKLQVQLSDVLLEFFIIIFQPRVVLDVWKRKQEDISENGENILVAWKPDSSAIAVVVSRFKISNSQSKYFVCPVWQKVR